MSAEKILEGQFRHWKSLDRYENDYIFRGLVNQFEEYAKQSKKEEVKCTCIEARTDSAYMSTGRITNGCKIHDKRLQKPQTQEKVEPSVSKLEIRKEWYKKFKESFPETIGETDNEFDLDNFVDFLVNQLNTLQDNGLREAAEKVVLKWIDKCAITAKDIEKLEKALK